MSYARAEKLYETIVAQIDDGRFHNAKEIALDALKASHPEQGADLIRPMVDVVLNFELGGQFGGDRVEVLLDARKLESLVRAVALLHRDDLRVVVQINGDRIPSETTDKLQITNRLIFFFNGPSSFLAMYKHPRHNIIVIQVVQR